MTSEELYEFIIDENTEMHYLNGRCYYFAIALHQRFGYDIIPIHDENGDVEHVMVQNDAGELLDIRGIVDPNNIITSWDYTVGDIISIDELNDNYMDGDHFNIWDNEEIRIANEIITANIERFNL